MEGARKISIFDKEISVRTYGCKNVSKEEPLFITIPRVNLFVQVRNSCQANCPFCIYKGNDLTGFNFEKYIEILKHLSSRKDLNIGKLNFTGGEPMLNFSTLERILNETKTHLDFSRKPEITLNTNGYNLEKILPYEDLIDSIGLSRHHYDDERNFKIFDTTYVPTNNEIKSFVEKLQNKKILQLRCNLINGEVDSIEKIKKYMNFAISIGVHDCGFVTLAPNNEFCKNHQVEFNSLIEINRDLIEVNSWERLEEDTNKSYCKCANYIYCNDNGEMCKFYARLFCRNDCKDGILVYDGQNLRFGFGGEIIY